MTIELTDKTLSLRPIQDEDLVVLSEIYGSTREEELKQVTHWSVQEKQGFIQQQFMAQHEYYQKNYIGAGFYLIVKNETPIGRLYIHENYQEDIIRIIDIAILPNWQNQGIGKSILEDILAEGNLIKKNVSIHVEAFNPAKHLYERLGFEKISETNGVYHLMQWNYKN
jgi:ribosomal protein S18 acetylase RimI-like enzyme